MADIREHLGKKILFFDGGMGTMLQKTDLVQEKYLSF